MTHDLSIKYWNNLYLNKGSAWDVGDISTPLKDYFDQLKNKNSLILIPGAGNGYEAEYLVKNGFVNVYVCDFAEEPLKNLLSRCPEIGRSHLLQTDFFDINGNSGSQVERRVGQGQTEQVPERRDPLTFDLIIEQTFFCALDPSLRQKYFDNIHQLLKQGGKLVGVLFNDTFTGDTAPFGGTAEEYQKYFEKCFKINVYETCYNSIKPRTGRELFINLEKLNHKVL